MLLSLIFSQALQEVFLPLSQLSCFLCFWIPLRSDLNLRRLDLLLFLFKGIRDCQIDSIDDVSSVRGHPSVIGEDLPAGNVAPRPCNWYWAFLACSNIMWWVIIDRVRLWYELHLQRLLWTLWCRAFAFIRLRVFDWHRFVHCLIANAACSNSGAHLLAINVS